MSDAGRGGGPMSRFRERARWTVARTMDKLPGQCWADLVTWALKWDRGLPWRPARAVCRQGLARNRFCYCGKLTAPDDPEGADAKEIAPESATAREAGASAGGAS